MNEEIKNIITEFLNTMGFSDFAVEVKQNLVPHPLTFKISIKEAGQLIGGGGANIFHLEYLIKIITKKKITEHEPFILDINDYRKSKEGFLKELAKTAAQKVALSGKVHILPPMPPYERRIIHLELAARPDIITESQGEGFVRHIIVKPNTT